jgi:predicted acetyltransferase
LSARRYPVAGELIVEVADEAGFANGRFRLEGGPDGASCVPTQAEPDLVLTVEALGAVCLGGTKLSLLAPAGLLEERRPGALGRADVLFGWPVVPWCWTEF